MIANPLLSIVIVTYRGIFLMDFTVNLCMGKCNFYCTIEEPSICKNTIKAMHIVFYYVAFLWFNKENVKKQH